MDREVVGICLALGLGGIITGIVGSWAPLRRSVIANQRAAAWQLCLPLVPSAAAWSLLAGWALQEPDLSDERLGIVWLTAAGVFGAVFVRAALRAVRSAAHRQAGAAATIGLFRPRIVIAPELLGRLDDDARRAVVEHEAAHARHRDPLRLLVAQFAADLQWPFPGARERLSAWRHALEIARDDEARRRGASGPDLAHAILVTAAMQRTNAGAALTGDGDRLRDRIDRLLAPISERSPDGTARWSVARFVALLLSGVGIGLAFGDDIVRSLPGVGG